MSSTDNTSPPPAGSYTSTNTPSQPPGKKKRARKWTADDRAAHRVFERSRREAFKERLASLANLVPSLGTTDPSRLSKHVVIDESIALHKEQQRKISRSLQDINMMLADRDEILAELNTWRTGAGLEARQPGFVPDNIEGAQDSTGPQLEGVTDGTWANGTDTRNDEILDAGQASLIPGGLSADGLMQPDADLKPAAPADFIDMSWASSPVISFAPLNIFDLESGLGGMISTRSHESTELMNVYDATGDQCTGGDISNFDIDRAPVMDPLSLSDNPFIHR
ncbi:hypothetical protein PT974_04813 [Cladobotryum mycophilum]|uniref:BHLH domain-containing protein n=1 Tax=Cladobotryum mycophilum TaxID=491253 RepID=A0ABR0SQK4_9HYPO